MWVRADLKQRAKDVLAKCYWMAFLVTLIATIFGGSPNFRGPQLNFSFNSGDFRMDRWNWNYNELPDLATGIAGALFGSIAVSLVLFFVALGVAYVLFVAGPLETGLSRYYIDARQGNSDFVNLFWAFRQGRYINVVKAMGWKMLFTFLWTLLFIIPGIVKGYAYAMIPYIMAENPGMDYREAMRLSMHMTDGQKWEMFVLDLSFLGWYLLGLLACCVGSLFVNPYYFATKAELYAELKHRVMMSGQYWEGGSDGYMTRV